MRNSFNVIVSILLMMFSYTSYSQLRGPRIKPNEYTRKNKSAPLYQYTKAFTYARGVYTDSSGMLYFGNADGCVIRYNMDTKSSDLVMKIPTIVEIRDLEVSGDTMFAMHSGHDGLIVKIAPEGPKEYLQLPEWEGVFLDALDFNGNVGFLMGDPVDSLFTLFHTLDGGVTWNRCEGQVKAHEGEVAFAASGSNVHVMNDSTYMFVTGGLKSNFYISRDNGATWSSVTLPFYPHKTIGPYSMCFADDKIGVMVGGNYLQPNLKLNTTYYTFDGGETWFNSMDSPSGYRSCVYHVNGVFYACGRNGIDFSTDGGETWTPFAMGVYFSLTHSGDQLIATTRIGRFQSFDLIQP